jgi:hypothetical protein
MRRIFSALLAVSAMACVSLPRPTSFANRPMDALLLEGGWSGQFNSGDGQRWGSIAFVLNVRNDTASGPAELRPVAFVQTGSAPARAEARAALRSPMRFVAVTDGVVAGVVPAFFDVDRMGMVQMTFIGRMRSWNVIEGTYVTLGTNLRVEERGTWRVVRQ